MSPKPKDGGAAEIDPFDEFLAIKLAEMPDYCPYCMRCRGLKRMSRIEFGYWRHHCGAEQDSRAGLAMLSARGGETQ